MHQYALKGIIPAGTGVNKPEQPVTDAESFLSTVNGWFANQRSARGGGAMDTYDTPVQDTYRERRYQWLSREEGTRQFAYDDKTGQQILPGQSPQGYATVGVGFNMDDSTSRARFGAALPGVPFDAVHNGQMPLNDAQIQKLFDFNVGETEAQVARTFQGTDLSEHQRLALVSLGFQRPAALPEVARAMSSGGVPAALSTMLRQPGSAGRRLREAALFVGPTDAPSVLANR